MATYEITAPDGQAYEVTAPDNASEATVLAYAKTQFEKPSVSTTQTATKRETTIAEDIAANPLTRFALGAASPVLGLGEWLPGKAGEVIAQNNRELQRIIEAGKQGQSEAMQFAGGAADVAGNILSPASLGMMKALPVAKTLPQLFGQGAATGAVSGAMVPTGSSDIADKASAAGIGAAVGGVATPVISKVLGGVTNLVAPTISESARDTAAGRLVAKAAGDRKEAVASALMGQKSGETAAETALPAGSSELTALQSLLKGNKGTEFGDVAREEAAKRMAALKGVTPDLAAEEANRAAGSSPFYAAAYKQLVKADSQLAQLASNPYFKSAQRESSDLIDAKGIDFKTAPIEYLQNVKMGLDKMLNRKGDTALGAGEYKEVAKLKRDLVDWMEKRSPLYEVARKQFARLSEPVNQAKVLGEMASVLEKPTGGERASPFLNVLGRGEESLIKSSTGVPRYVIGDLQKVLTKDQFDVVQGIAGKLKANAEISAREAEGMKSALEAIRATESKDVRLPALVNYKIGIINNLLNRLEGAGGKRVETRAAELMLPGRGKELSGLMTNAINNPQGWVGSVPRTQGLFMNPLLRQAYEEKMLTGEQQ